MEMRRQMYVEEWAILNVGLRLRRTRNLLKIIAVDRNLSLSEGLCAYIGVMLSTLDCFIAESNLNS
jgi:hypothetical protein